MDAWVWILIAAVVIIVVGGLVSRCSGGGSSSSSSAELQESFGPEYERTVEEADSQREAERELHERQERRDELDIRPLAPGARDRSCARGSSCRRASSTTRRGR